MAYDTRYEPSADWIMNQIVARTKTYLKGGTAFSATTSPDLTEVEAMIDDRTFLIVGILTKAGYAEAQPVATVGTSVTTMLSRAIVQGTLLDIEQTKPNQSQGRGESARWMLYERMWTEMIELFRGATLQQMGATKDRDASNGLVFTGNSWDDQEDVAEDEDQKGSLFPRGFLDPQARRESLVEISDPTNTP